MQEWPKLSLGRTVADVNNSQLTLSVTVHGLLRRMVVQSTGLHSVEGTFQFSMLTLDLSVLLQLRITPWDIVQREDVANL